MTYTITINSNTTAEKTHVDVRDFELSSSTLTVQISDTDFWVYPLTQLRSVHVVASVPT